MPPIDHSTATVDAYYSRHIQCPRNNNNSFGDNEDDGYGEEQFKRSASQAHILVVPRGIRAEVLETFFDRDEFSHYQCLGEFGYTAKGIGISLYHMEFDLFAEYLYYGLLVGNQCSSPTSSDTNGVGGGYRNGAGQSTEKDRGRAVEFSFVGPLLDEEPMELYIGVKKEKDNEPPKKKVKLTASVKTVSMTTKPRKVKRKSKKSKRKSRRLELSNISEGPKPMEVSSNDSASTSSTEQVVQDSTTADTDAAFNQNNGASETSEPILSLPEEGSSDNHQETSDELIRSTTSIDFESSNRIQAKAKSLITGTVENMVMSASSLEEGEVLLGSVSN